MVASLLKPPLAQRGERASAVRLPAGQSVLLNPGLRPDGACLEVLEGVARVYCPCEETEGMTLAFLQTGDQLRTDRLCSEGVCVEALTPLLFCSEAEPRAGEGFDPVNEWTLQLLRIRHLGQAEQRLHALLALLVNRLGRRCGSWCDLPFRLSHERIGELIGTTRVTTTRLISRIRQAELIEIPAGSLSMRLAPQLVENAPLAAG
ncbi:MAG: helix-turn-helix domain-containing protein [Cyanobacteriota bacterium]|nr:helix-turn-helix domain-containing protein [Cyanobacteriota bacterium]